MKKFNIVIFFLLFSCTPSKNANNFNNKFFFSENISFHEFKIKVQEYANKSSYPNIDNQYEQLLQYSNCWFGTGW